MSIIQCNFIETIRKKRTHIENDKFGLAHNTPNVTISKWPHGHPKIKLNAKSPSIRRKVFHSSNFIDIYLFDSTEKNGMNKHKQKIEKKMWRFCFKFKMISSRF